MIHLKPFSHNLPVDVVERSIMKIKEVKKKNGEIVYRTQVSLGTDTFTGKNARKTITAKSKRELNTLVQQAKEEFIKNGYTTFKHATATTFNELATLWLENHKPTVKLQSYNGTVTIFNRHILPRLGSIRLQKLNTVFMQQFVSDVANSGYKGFKRVFSLVRNVLQYGVVLQLMPSNPMLNTITPNIKYQTIKKRDKYLKPEEVRQLLDYLDSLPPTYVNQYDTTLYKFLLATGLRIGEMLALSWSDVDLDNRTVSVNKTVIGETGAIGTPKSQSAYRTISFDKETALMLRLYKNRQTQYFKEIACDSEVIFATGRTEYGTRSNTQNRLDKHLKKAGIARFTFHTFRHTHASLLINAGIGNKQLQTRLGHSTLSMTMDIYSHMFESTEKTSPLYYEKALKNLSNAQNTTQKIKNVLLKVR